MNMFSILFAFFNFLYGLFFVCAKSAIEFVCARVCVDESNVCFLPKTHHFSPAKDRFLVFNVSLLISVRIFVVVASLRWFPIHPLSLVSLRNCGHTLKCVRFDELFAQHTYTLFQTEHCTA